MLIEQDLELTPVALAGVQDRACASLQAFPQDYCAADEREVTLEPLLARVRAAKSIANICDLLGLDSFKAYWASGARKLR